MRHRVEEQGPGRVLITSRLGPTIKMSYFLSKHDTFLVVLQMRIFNASKSLFSSYHISN